MIRGSLDQGAEVAAGEPARKAVLAEPLLDEFGEVRRGEPDDLREGDAGLILLERE